MNKDERLDEHQKFRELAALAQRGALTDSERLALDRHLALCLACREAHAEFALGGDDEKADAEIAKGVAIEKEGGEERLGVFAELTKLDECVGEGDDGQHLQEEDAEVDHVVGVEFGVAVGVGVGVGAGLLLAPASGQEIRNSISEKVQDISDKVKGRVSSQKYGATGTE